MCNSPALTLFYLIIISSIIVKSHVVPPITIVEQKGLIFFPFITRITRIFFCITPISSMYSFLKTTVVKIFFPFIHPGRNFAFARLKIAWVFVVSVWSVLHVTLSPSLCCLQGAFLLALWWWFHSLLCLSNKLLSLRWAYVTYFRDLSSYI